MGDDGWLAELSDRIHSFNFLGDTHWCAGTVVAKSQTDLHDAVEIELSSVNQREESSATATATVYLPSRERGPVILGNAPGDYWRAAAAMLTPRGGQAGSAS
jgi:hypothetical protein